MTTEPNQSAKGEDRTAQKRRFRSDRIPEDAGKESRGYGGKPACEPEDSEGARQLGLRSGLGDEHGEDSLRGAEMQTHEDDPDHDAPLCGKKREDKVGKNQDAYPGRKERLRIRLVRPFAEGIGGGGKNEVHAHDEKGNRGCGETRIGGAQHDEGV